MEIHRKNLSLPREFVGDKMYHEREYIKAAGAFRMQGGVAVRQRLCGWLHLAACASKFWHTIF